MATQEQLKAALKRAAEAGDTASANEIAALLDQQFGEPAQTQQKRGPTGRRTDTVMGNFLTGADLLNRGFQRLIPGVGDPKDQASIGEIGSEAGRVIETAARNAAGPIGGDYIGGATEFLVNNAQGEGQSYGDAVQNQRDRRAELNADQNAGLLPVAAEMAGFGGVVGGVRRLPGAAALQTGKAGGTLAQRGVNAAKVAAESALVGGVGTLAQTGDTNKALGQGAIDAVLAPGVSGVLRAGGEQLAKVPERIMKMFTGGRGGLADSEKTISLLAKRLKMEPEEARTLVAEYQQIKGRPPSIAEILDNDSKAAFREIGEVQREAGDVFEERRRATDALRPGEMRAVVEDGVPSQSTEALTTQRDDLLSAALRGGRAPIAAEALDDEVIEEFLKDHDVYDALPRTLKRDVLSILNGEGGYINVDLMENVRQALKKRSGPGDAYRYTELARDVSEMIKERSPRYARVFERYSDQSRYIEGAERGATVLRGSTADFEQVVPSQSVPEKFGVQRGARAAIANAAGESPQQALNTAKRLQSEGVRRRLEAVSGTGEANRLSELGRLEQRTAENYAALVGNREIPNAVADFFQAVAETGAVASGKASPTGLSFFTRNVVNRLKRWGIPADASVKVASLITDPYETINAIAALERAGMRREEIQNIMRDAAIAALAANNEED